MFFWSTGKGGIKCVSDFTLQAPEYKLYKYFIIINDLQGLIPNTVMQTGVSVPALLWHFHTHTPPGSASATEDYHSHPGPSQPPTHLRSVWGYLQGNANWSEADGRR